MPPAPPYPQLNLTDLRTYIRRRLGSPAIVVELTDEQINDTIRDAIDLYNRHLPGQGVSALAATGTQKRYTIDQPGLIGVIEMQFVRRTQLGSADLNNPFVLDYATKFPEYAADYEQLLSSLKDARRVFSSLPEWRGGWEEDKVPSSATYGQYIYVVYVDLPTYSVLAIPYQVAYFFTWARTPDDDPQLGIGTIPQPHHQWVKDYCVALAKATLSIVRGKFGGIPSPDGADMALDQAELSAQAEADLARLREDIAEMQESIPPIFE